MYVWRVHRHRRVIHHCHRAHNFFPLDIGIRNGELHVGMVLLGLARSCWRWGPHWSRLVLTDVHTSVARYSLEFDQIVLSSSRVVLANETCAPVIYA